MTAARICCVCDKPILGESRKIPRHSMSGARPDDYAHLDGDEDCQPPRRPGRPARPVVRRRVR